MTKLEFCGRVWARDGQEVFKKTIQAEIPEQLYKRAVAPVKEGWFPIL